MLLTQLWLIHYFAEVGLNKHVSFTAVVYCFKTNATTLYSMQYVCKGLKDFTHAVLAKIFRRSCKTCYKYVYI